MSGVTAPPPAARRSARESSASWRLTDRLGLALAWVLGVLFLVVTAAIVLYMMVQGLRYVRPELFVTSPAAGFSESETGGFLDPLLGTVIVAAMAMAIAFPVGLGVGVWLSEYGRPSALARVTESTVEMLAGTPSIVFALFGTLLFEQGALALFSRTNDGVVYGRSFFAAAAMLSFVALPLVVANVREGLQAIPGHVREASYAVGKTKLTTTRRVLLPAARPSVVTGAMLGVGRIIGDTAIIVLLLGATLRFNGAGEVPLLETLRGTGSTLTSYVYANAPTGEANQPTKAYAAGFVLLSMVLLLNVAVDFAVRRGRRWR
ncbi:PstA family ABC transporter permease [Conexibacter woesei]|uniref:Binding-protein-dependent transport systems inner membrane component n=1 Tax=Conexibacter woesei (strain DSM 14684 / CCUG 47730 / CIP 108061 / JCM 11494 / NBRC 100937 / ID131577) TaxID=469383 RepID=D3FD41_CONWI|nr:ABC transporter permease subunit [Conexibacter woesei]ADB53433.1 binding-protein-dependent transport systems inner membrane component [Conexibacter woesei DSM 14684]